MVTVLFYSYLDLSITYYLFYLSKESKESLEFYFYYFSNL